MIYKHKVENDSYQSILNFLNPNKYEKPDLSDPFKKKYDNIESFILGKPIPEDPIPVEKPTTAEIIQHIEADLMFMNVNSVQSSDKRELVEAGIRKIDPDVAILAETKHGHDDPEFNIDGYDIITHISRKPGAGGMQVLAKKTMEILEPNAESICKEVQVIDFILNEYLIIGVYRSPNPIGPELNQHEKLIKYLSKRLDKHPPGEPFIITGDFNLPKLAACDFQPTIRTMDYSVAYDDRQETINQLWAAFFLKYNLIQHIKDPSRATSSNVLDLLISSRNQDVPFHKVPQNVFHNTLDHFPVVFKIETNYTSENIMKTRRLTGPKNLKNLRNRIISRNLYQIIPKDTAENAANCLTAELKYALDQECPYVEVKPPPKTGYKSREQVRQMRQANRLKYSLKNHEEHTTAHKEIKEKLRKANKSSKFMRKRDRENNDIRRFEISAKKDRNFYQHVKKYKNKQATRIGPIFDSNGTLRSSKEEMTAAFGEKLGNDLKPSEDLDVLRMVQENSLTLEQLPFNELEKEKPYPDWFTPHPESPAEQLTHKQAYMTPEFIIEQIKKAKRDSAAGPDDIPMLVYAVTKDIIAPVLALIFSLINQTGDIPTTFRATKVCLLFKKKDKRDMNNYRPLSMSNQLGKIWERCINFLIIEHLEAHGLLHDKQDGFRPKRGTFSNLSKLWDTVTKKVEKYRSLVELWNFDLTKAFDRLDHSIALRLCHKAGIGGYLGLCLQNWLTTRTQFVEMDIYRSPETEVGRSCVQGSVLGPTLWILYINTLLERLENSKTELDFSFYAYADDLSIVKHIHTNKELFQMHDILDILQKWAEDYGMEWSAAKTQRLVFKHRGGREPRDPRQIYFNNKHIIPMETRALKTKCESLGIIVSKDLMFTDQTNRCAYSIRSLTSIMSKFFNNKTERLLRRFYLTFIVPKFTYCSQVWQPGEEKYLQKINNAVTKYWKMNKRKGPRGGPPPDILEPTLQYMYIDMLFVHKVYHGGTKLEFNDFFEFNEAGTRQAGKLKLPKFDLKFNKHKMSYRAAMTFNMLPTEYYDLPPSLFKRAAKAHIMDNKNSYKNLAREIPITEDPPSALTRTKTPTLNEMIESLKATNLSRESDWMKMGVNVLIKGQTRFWIPLSEQISTIITKSISETQATMQEQEQQDPNTKEPTKLKRALSRLL